jgi:hypothetical protein
MTKWVHVILRSAAEAQKAEWDKVSWEGGEASPLLLCELRTRADAYMALEETSYEQWCERAGIDPVFE